MPPKKNILLVHDDARRMEQLRFLLTTRRYRVMSAASAADALVELEGVQYFPAFGPQTLDLVLVELRVPGALGLIRAVKRMHPDMPVMLLSDEIGDFPEALEADAFLPEHGDNAAELLARVRLLMIRKRGPRPPAPQSVGAVPDLHPPSF